MYMLFFLLQGSSPLEARQNPLYLKVFFGLLLLIIPAIVIVQILNFFSRLREKRHNTNQGEHPASFRTIKNAADQYGFNKQQLAFFHQICRKYRIHNPEFLLKNDAVADKLFRTIYQSLERSGSTENSENAKLLIFSIRQQMEQCRRLTRAIRSTQSIVKGQSLSISARKLGTAQATVLENSTNGLIISIPRDEYNNEVRLSLFSRIHVFFQMSTGISYSYNAFLMRYINKATISAMVLNHNKKLIPMHNRSFKRVELEKTCFFTGVKMSKKGKGANVQTVYTAQQDYSRGTLLDISGGGCRIKSNSPVNQGNFISIQLQLIKDMDPVIARVVRINKIPDAVGYILNIQFIRMKKSIRNIIYSFVYDYK